MNALELLKADHAKVQELFRQCQGTEGKGNQPKQDLAEQIFTEIEIHSKIEEEIFYPAVRAKMDQETQDLVADSLEEHQAVKQLIQELRRLKPQDEAYNVKFEELMESVEEHIGEEEDELFPDVAEQLRAELDSLGRQLGERKGQLMATSR